MGVDEGHVAFVGDTAYVLVANVGSFFGEPEEVAGIYRVRRDGSAVPVADLGTWSTDNPPDTEFVLPGGVHYAMEPFGGGFAVTDGHHNRVLYAGRDGQVRELLAFGNVVPTGLAAAGRTLFVGQAGPVPHLPEDGKVVALTPRSDAAVQIAAGAPLIVDVELGPDCGLYALAQGIWDLPPLPQQRRRAGVGEHREPYPGRPPQPARADRRAARPPDLGRVLPQQRVRGDARRQGPPDRRHHAPSLIGSRQHCGERKCTDAAVPTGYPAARSRRAACASNDDRRTPHRALPGAAMSSSNR